MSGPRETSELDLLLIVVRRWRTMIVFAVVVTGAAIAYSYVTPEWYEARLAVVPAVPSRESAAMALAARLPGLDPVSADSKRIEAVLTSASVADAVIDKFKLQERYGAVAREHTRAALWGHCATSVDRKSGVVALTCEDTDPQLAMDLAAYFGEVGNRVFGRISASSASEEARFLETQLTKARTDLDDASRRLREFQEQHKIIDLPEQSKAVISAMASIKGELLSKQLELSYLSGFSGRGETTVMQLQQQITIMEAKLKQLEAAQQQALPPKPAGTGSGADFFPGAMNVPELRFELEQLLRDQKIKETVFSLMTQRYEMAKVDAARDTSAFQILDHPTLPTFRSRPIRRKVAMTGLAAGLALGCLWVIAPAWWRRRTRQS